MRTLVWLLLSVFTCLAQHIPFIRVYNAAAQGGAAYESNLIARGSLLTVLYFGTAPLFTYDPTTLHVSLHWPDGSIRSLSTVPAPFNEMWVLVPDDVPLGRASLVLTIEGTPQPPAQIVLTTTAPGLFTRRVGQNRATGHSGPGLVQATGIDGLPRLNRLTDAAQVGESLTIWGTGLKSAALRDIQVRVGSALLTPFYAGTAPGLPGVDQINVVLPRDGTVPTGCFVSAQVGFGSLLSNEVSVTIAERSGACDPPLGLLGTDLARLENGEQVLIGQAFVGSSVFPSLTTEVPTFPLQFAFQRIEGASLDLQPIGIELLPGISAVRGPGASLRGCLPTGGAESPRTIFGVREFDAGKELTLSGPRGSQTLQKDFLRYDWSLLAPQTAVAATELPPMFLANGRYELKGTGGATFQAFTAAVRIPSLRWTNRDFLAAIDVQSDPIVMWEVTEPDPTDVVIVSVGSNLRETSSTDPTTVRAFTCTAPASDGQLSIPGSLLRRLPPEVIRVTSPLIAASLTIQLQRRPGQQDRFTMPLTAGGLAPGIFDYFIGYSQPVTLR